MKKRRERDHARHAAQTVSERQATSQRKSTGECGAETPEEREINEERKFSDVVTTDTDESSYCFIN